MKAKEQVSSAMGPTVWRFRLPATSIGFERVVTAAKTADYNACSGIRGMSAEARW